MYILDLQTFRFLARVWLLSSAVLFNRGMWIPAVIILIAAYFFWLVGESE